ncbi:MAG: hypothetical protein J1E64_04600 [Acetatifactor sp.]|nr:hypothetical protein [Acetatifactor sp.]
MEPKKARNFSVPQLALFSESSLVILASVVTLLLQLISFVNTWNGSQVYLEGIFPFASLLFAVAIQSTAYFFSNSLRDSIRPLKVAALTAAMCCSTYYAYVGIYNSVNSPVTYLQENYLRITHDLTDVYEESLQGNLSASRQAVSGAVSRITARYASLMGQQENINACYETLAGLENSYSSGMGVPRQSSYENYEDYVEAYQAYVAGMSAGNTAESRSARQSVLSSYGFSSMEALNQARSENTAALSALESALGIANLGEAPTTQAFMAALSSLSGELTDAIEEASQGRAFTSADTTALNRLFQAARQCGYEDDQLSQILHAIDRCAETSSSPLMAEYDVLVSYLPESRVTSANTMDLKSSMDSEILSALIKINALLPEEEQISFSDTRFLITDLHLIPIRSIQDPTTRTTALFCFGVAALIDLLSVLFAVSLRGQKPLWNRRRLSDQNLEDYLPQIYAALPTAGSPAGSGDSWAHALTDFLSRFLPSPKTEKDGYMMQAEMSRLQGYYPLTALLCQINLAKLIPAGFLDNDTEILLLKARFVFWANEMIYER